MEFIADAASVQQKTKEMLIRQKLVTPGNPSPVALDELQATTKAACEILKVNFTPKLDNAVQSLMRGGSVDGFSL